MSTVSCPPAAVVLRCQENGCGEYTRFDVLAEELARTDRAEGLQDLSPAFWARARCASCGGSHWEGVLYPAMAERRT